MLRFGVYGLLTLAGVVVVSLDTPQPPVVCVYGRFVEGDQERGRVAFEVFGGAMRDSTGGFIVPEWPNALICATEPPSPDSSDTP